MQSISDRTISEMVDCLVEKLDPEQIYLFGSHAYGKPHRYSDLDFLVVVNDEAGDPDELSLAGRRAVLDFPACVDILVYHRHEMDKWVPVKCSLPHTVAQKGKLLYGS